MTMSNGNLWITCFIKWHLESSGGGGLNPVFSTALFSIMVNGGSQRLLCKEERVSSREIPYGDENQSRSTGEVHASYEVSIRKAITKLNQSRRNILFKLRNGEQTNLWKIPFSVDSTPQ
uniref:Uncharacterized protein n=1 Tax=Nelumbo nucifera TaxID=4432 RepID=A0A822Z5S3_NELNU|nr:TPA_asm: hypothetical protein HUJ06_013061 [Nelumbo nucifera]